MTEERQQHTPTPRSRPRSRPESVDLLADELARAQHIVAFTGAGISTESGIPDFRSPGGLWDRYRPIDYRDFMTSAQARREAWRRKLGTRTTLTAARPNRGHEALFLLFEIGRLGCVVTQNIDGLHQLSGIPESRVVELHGNATYALCMNCNQRYELDPLLAEFEQTNVPPSCASCSGVVKSATISFGQPMPETAMQRAEAACASCDLLLVLGTSLVVYPAAGFPRFAKAHGARIVIVNREPTDHDALFDLCLNTEIGDVLMAAASRL